MGPLPGVDRHLLDVGGRFVDAHEMTRQAERLRVPTTGLAFRGRLGPLGPLAAGRAAALLGGYPTWAVEAAWASSSHLPRAEVVRSYTSACAAWAERLGPDDDHWDAVAEAGFDAVDAVPAGHDDLALFAAWRERPRPPVGAVGAAWAFMLLWELHSGACLTALRGAALDRRHALLLRGGPEELTAHGWTADEVNTLLAEADADPGMRERLDRAEERAFGVSSAAFEALPAARRGLLLDAMRLAAERT